MMLLRVALFVFATTLARSNADDEINPLSDEFIHMINSKQNSWKAGRNFPPQTKLDTLKKLMGAKEDTNYNKLPTIEHDAAVIADLPENFDPRNKWPNCPSLNEVRDQGACGSAWAFGAVEIMTDRYCIFSNGTRHFHFSAEDLLSCCDLCGSCIGGYPTSAFKYWEEFGIVSGGNYNSSQGCQPYEIPPCEHHVHGDRLPCGQLTETPECEVTCAKDYNKSYEDDKMYGTNLHTVTGGEANIRAEIFKNGPVAAVFIAYSDFLTYKSGVYRHTAGDELGNHEIKIMGWGVENGRKYWLTTNSWNTDWGDKGFFKIVRGEDHCGIESAILAGEPLFL